MIPLQWLKPPKKIAAVPLRLQQRRIPMTNKQKKSGSAAECHDIEFFYFITSSCTWPASLANLPWAWSGLGIFARHECLATTAHPSYGNLLLMVATGRWTWNLHVELPYHVLNKPTSRRIRSRRRTGQRIRSRRRTGRRIRSWRRTGRRIRSCRQASRSHPGQMNNTVPQTTFL